MDCLRRGLRVTELHDCQDLLQVAAAFENVINNLSWYAFAHEFLRVVSCSVLRS